MSTLSQIIYSITSIALGGDSQSDDANLSTEHVKFLVLNTRAYLIRQDLNKNRSYSDNILQVLSCVPVSDIDASLCPCSVPSSCSIKRTDIKIPNLIELNFKDYLTKVSGVNIQGTGFSIIPYSRASVAGSSRWTANNPKAFVHNSYVYLINSPNLEFIAIQGIFEDPTQAANFSNCLGTPCFSDDSEFPISAHMIPALKDLVLKDLKLQVSIPSDTQGNESQKTQPQTGN